MKIYNLNDNPSLEDVLQIPVSGLVIGSRVAQLRLLWAKRMWQWILCPLCEGWLATQGGGCSLCGNTSRLPGKVLWNYREAIVSILGRIRPTFCGESELERYLLKFANVRGECDEDDFDMYSIELNQQKDEEYESKN